MSLSDYLTKKYLTPVEGKKSKKKKHTINKKKSFDTSNTIGSDITGWDDDEALVKDELVDSDDDEVLKQEIINDTSTGNRGWKGIGNRVEIKQEEIKREEWREESSNEVNISEKSAKTGVSRMSNGAKAGLQTCAEIQKDVDRKKAIGLKELNDLSNDLPTETVYRDNQGRLLDVLQEQEEEKKRQEQEKAHQIKLQKEINSGWIQNSMASERASYLKSMASTSLNQYADDAGLNQIQKSRQRFNDPAARFLSKDRQTRTVSDINENSLPRYKGSFEPNRFGIAPGALWDGVDRSTGFETKWLTRQNEIKADRSLSYSSTIDV